MNHLIRANILGLERNLKTDTISLIARYGQQRWKLTGQLKFNSYYPHSHYNSTIAQQDSILGGRVIDIFDCGVIVTNGNLTIECSGINRFEQLLNVNDDQQWLEWIARRWGKHASQQL